MRSKALLIAAVAFAFLISMAPLVLAKKGGSGVKSGLESVDKSSSRLQAGRRSASRWTP